MNDLKASVKKAANDAMELVADCSGNKDLEKFVATIVRGIKTVLEVTECVEELAGCIFVQNVEAQAVRNHSLNRSSVFLKNIARADCVTCEHEMFVLIL